MSVIHPFPQTDRYSLAARWVLPVEAAPLANGWVEVANEKIVAVGQGHSPQPSVDLGNVAILPGFVNAHAHLEFSTLDKPLGQPGMELAEWISQVVAWRRSPAYDRSRALELGLRESLQSGVTSLGEIAGPGSWNATMTPQLDVTVFHELLAPTPERATEALREVDDFLSSSDREPSRWRPALSPHAPYSVLPDVFDAVASTSERARVPVACHLAESTSERQLLAQGDGPFAKFLASRGMPWPKDRLPRGTRPLDFLRRLAAAHRLLVIHGNYLDADEIDFLASYQKQSSVVYCPRTHAYFAHARYPLVELLARGINVALGTDGRGSNPDLSILAEMRYVARQFAELPAEKVVELGTLAGARALGIDREVGSIAPGKVANLAVVTLPTGEPPANPYQAVLFGDGRVIATVYRGKA